MYYLTYILFYAISLLPFRVLYLISDILYVILYRIAKYRLQVVRENLRNSLPEKTVHELLHIEDAYYHNLCDSIVETVKLLSINATELDKRIQCNWTELEKMKQSGKSAIVMISHQFNWEWATVLTRRYTRTYTDFAGLYMPLTSKVFDRLFLKLRTRHDVSMVKVQDMKTELGRRQKTQHLWGIIADQNPSDPKRVSWNDFLLRKTAFYKGPEFIAKRYDTIVFFGEAIKVKRGYYELKIRTAFEHPRDTKEGEITETYVRFLEQNIKSRPTNWVWSHRRWKHVFPHSQLTEIPPASRTK